MENNGHVLRLRLISAGTLDEIYASLIRQIVSTPLGAENWSFASAPCVKYIRAVADTVCGAFPMIAWFVDRPGRLGGVRLLSAWHLSKRASLLRLIV